jgi:hypothetical protein
MNNADMPALPGADTYHPNGQVEYGATGVTKREYFAAMAMSGLLAGPYGDCDVLAVCAVDAADALLKRLERPG